MTEVMESRRRISRLPFVFVVVFCLLQTCWWIWVHLGSVHRIEDLELQQAALDKAGDPVALARAEHGIHVEAAGRRRMFLLEGGTFVLLILLGTFAFSRAVSRELRLRAQHEDFLRAATHELKTPLASLKLGLQSLAQGRLDAAGTPELFEELGGQVDRIELEVENMLLAARGRDEGPRFESGSLDQDLGLLREEFETRGRTGGVRLRLESEEGLQLQRDPMLLNQALRNLIDNAIKYSPAGSEVLLRAMRRGARLCILVEDQGPGVPPEDRERIFGRFVRGRSAEAASRGGSGLGLFLAAEAARAHGGSLRLVEGEGEGEGEGSGACFELELPGEAA